MSTALDKTQMAAFRAAMEAELNELDALIEGSELDRRPVELDQQSVGRLSRMDAMQGQAVAQEADRRRQSRRLALKIALRRIDEGDYGDCTECGEPIAIRRLEIDPAAALCISCASRS